MARLEKVFFWIKERVTWRNPLRYLAKIQNVSSYALRVTQYLTDADIIVLHNEPNILIFLKKRENQRLVLHMHNDHLTHQGFHWLYNKALHKVDQVICVSEYIKKNAVQYFPQHAHKFVVVFNATDSSIFKPYHDAKSKVDDIISFEQGKKYLLYVGRLTPNKGVDILIQAFRKIISSRPEARLIIAGSSFFEGAVKTEYQEQLIHLAKPISHAIIFTGFVPHENLKYLYSSVDVIILPSVWQDPCPLVVLEAMASGTCLIASKVGGVPEIIEDEVSGLLVPPKDISALFEKVLYILDEPVMKNKIEKAARKKILSSYTWTHLVSKLEQVLLA